MSLTAICVTKENKIVLVKQFRYAFNEIIYEIPAGKLEKGEITSEEITRSYFERIKEKDPEIKAYISTLEDEAHHKVCTE